MDTTNNLSTGPEFAEQGMVLESNELQSPINTFVPGGRALLIDEKGREAFVKLKVGGQSHTHAEQNPHEFHNR